MHGNFGIYLGYNTLLNRRKSERTCFYPRHGGTRRRRLRRSRQGNAYLFLCHRIGSRILHVLIPKLTSIRNTSNTTRSLATTIVLNLHRHFNGISRLRTALVGRPLPSGPKLHGACLTLCSAMPKKANCLGRLSSPSAVFRILTGTGRIVRRYRYTGGNNSKYCEYLCTCERDRGLGLVSHGATLAVLANVLSPTGGHDHIGAISGVTAGGLFSDKLRRRFIRTLQYVRTRPFTRSSSTGKHHTVIGSRFVGDGPKCSIAIGKDM